jgi:hypothetical protein
MKECAVIALSFLLAWEFVGVPTQPPGWNDDYGLAVRQARAAKKPLAVFVGTGRDGWKAACSEGDLGPEVRRLLAEEYVCLYVDAGQAAHKELAQSFEAGQAPLLVLSSRCRAYQAYRHEGAQPTANLALALRRHATEEAAPVAIVSQAPCRT